MTDHLTLLHFSDLHLWRLGLDYDPYFKRVLGLINLIVRRGRKFPASAAAAVIERLAAERADYVLCSGDLTTTSLRAEFLAARRLLTPLLERYGERFIAIPGNHDRYTPRAARGGHFEKLFHDYAACSLPFARDLDGRWTLVGYDCAVPQLFASCGFFGPQSMARLDALLAEHQARGRRLLVMGHYPLVYPEGAQKGRLHALPQRRELLDIMQRRGVSLYLHGHVHHRWCLRTGDLIHLNSGSAGMAGHRPERRPGFLKLELDANGLASAQAHWLKATQPPYYEKDWENSELLLK